MLVAALVCSGLGLAWLALAMDVHWQQVFGPRPQSRGTVVILRGLAVLELAGSLALCLRADHASTPISTERNQLTFPCPSRVLEDRE